MYSWPSPPNKAGECTPGGEPIWFNKAGWMINKDGLRVDCYGRTTKARGVKGAQLHRKAGRISSSKSWAPGATGHDDDDEEEVEENPWKDWVGGAKLDSQSADDDYDPCAASSGDRPKPSTPYTEPVEIRRYGTRGPFYIARRRPEDQWAGGGYSAVDWWEWHNRKEDAQWNDAQDDA